MRETKQVNFIFFVTVLLYIGASFFLSWAKFLELPMILSMLLSQMIIFVPSFLYCLMKKISWKEIVSFRKMKISVWILVVICTYLMYPLIIVVNAVSLIFVESGTAEMMTQTSQWNFFLSTFMMAVMPAFVEEFVFRGVLYGTYRQGRKWLAILVSAFLFGCMHMNFNQFLYAFVLGVYLSFLIEATGSIFSSMLAHFTINFTSVILSKVLEVINQFVPAMEEQMGTQTGNFLNTMGQESLIILIIGILIWGVIALGTTAAAFGIYLVIAKISGRMEHIKTMFFGNKKEKIFSVFLILGIFLTLVIMILQVI